MKKLIVSFVIMITIPAFAFCAQLDHKQNKGQSLQEFWSVFRGEVLAGDKKKIASMTKFPFKTRVSQMTTRSLLTTEIHLFACWTDF